MFMIIVRSGAAFLLVASFMYMGTSKVWYDDKIKKHGEKSAKRFRRNMYIMAAISVITVVLQLSDLFL